VRLAGITSSGFDGDRVAGREHVLRSDGFDPGLR
jgi:hypothetical protein